MHEVFPAFVFTAILALVIICGIEIYHRLRGSANDDRDSANGERGA